MRLHINMLIPSNTDCTVNYIIKKNSFEGPQYF